jgi:three-Cys-motif partner protein
MRRQRADKDVKTGEMFPDLPTIVPARKYVRPTVPVWTEHKANFIRRYLKLFIQITKHGTYIDGFAGAQRANLQNAWSAPLVLQIRPTFLRHFFLCEKDAKSFADLQECVAEEPLIKGRTVQLYHGDFNKKVDDILSSPFITDREATFALLDQRTFECHWKTVQKLAAKKQGMKIELFYFFGFGWVKRALAGVTKNKHIIERWWGRDDFESIKDRTREDISETLTKRFRSELGYKYVTPYPIFMREENNIVMYQMVHATDHDVAPELMNRAYRQAVRTSQKVAIQLQLPDTF